MVKNGRGILWFRSFFRYRCTVLPVRVRFAGFSAAGGQVQCQSCRQEKCCPFFHAHHFLSVQKGDLFTPLLLFTTPAPGGTCPRAGGVKNKNAVQGKPTQRQKRELPNATRAQKENAAKPPFTKGRNVVSYSMRCGQWPLCRWFEHLCRLAGAPTPVSCRIFVFRRFDYSREGLEAQELLPKFLSAPEKQPSGPPKAARWAALPKRSPGCSCPSPAAGRGKPPLPSGPSRRPRWGGPLRWPAVPSRPSGPG